MANEAHLLRVGTYVFTPNSEHDGVIVAVNRKKGTALVCTHYGAAAMRTLGVTLDYIRRIFPCKAYNLTDLTLDDEAD